MLSVLNIFWNICRIRANPQDLPSNTTLLAYVILFGVIADSIASAILITRFSYIEVLFIIAVYSPVMLAIAAMLLKVLGYRQRIVQTVTAIAGAGLLISLVLLPALLYMHATGNIKQSLAVFILADNIWRIVVNAHIFRHALSVGLLMAMIISVCYLLLGILVADFIIPAKS